MSFLCSLPITVNIHYPYDKYTISSESLCCACEKHIRIFFGVFNSIQKLKWSSAIIQMFFNQWVFQNFSIHFCTCKTNLVWTYNLFLHKERKKKLLISIKTSLFQIKIQFRYLAKINCILNFRGALNSHFIYQKYPTSGF